MMLMLREQKIKRDIQFRSDRQKTSLRNQRILVNCVSAVWIALGWIAIYYSTFYENEMGDWVNERFGLTGNFFQEWTATLIMTIVGYIVPYILGKLSNYSRWDLAEESLYDDLWKNFYTMILNITLFGIVQF